MQELGDFVHSWTLEVLMGALTVAFGVWARTVKIAGGDIADKMEQSTEKLASQLQATNRSLNEFMRVTEARLTRLETKQEAYESVVVEVHEYLKKIRSID